MDLESDGTGEPVDLHHIHEHKCLPSQLQRGLQHEADLVIQSGKILAEAC